MSKGKIITLDELFAEKRAEMEAWCQTDEYKELERRNHEKFLREEAARLKWEAENKPTPFEAGRAAAENGEDREPPEDVPSADIKEWMAGYDDWIAEQEDDGE